VHFLERGCGGRHKNLLFVSEVAYFFLEVPAAKREDTGAVVPFVVASLTRRPVRDVLAESIECYTGARGYPYSCAGMIRMLLQRTDVRSFGRQKVLASRR